METVNLKSGEFLVKDVDAKDIFIPEEFNEEQRMIAQTCRDFMEAEVFPNLEKIDKGDRELMKSILHKAGELGMLGIAVPEEYNGFGQDFVTQMLVAETTGAGYSFSVAYMCHCGIGTMPIMYYGNEEQRQNYVSRLATGELIGAYCLTEPGAGSDANSGKTTATLSEDGKHYILNGQKMWITNGGFCDTQVVFAKIDNDRILSAFIVESDWPGVVIGPDEHKMGIKGSSTTQIYYNDVKVPVENMIGARGEGFRIALSILHMGRMKLGANVIGAAKQTITDAVRYANERKQFNTLISNFGAIKHKLAQMAIKTFAHESAIYRVSKDVEILINKYKSEGCDQGRAAIDGISHYAVEDAILKVWGSEMLDYVVDEGVQIHGGMGYSAEMNIDRGYRDSRINRIFEGTNEINRLLVVEAATKRAMKGEYNLFELAEELHNNLDTITDGAKNGESYFEQKRRYMQNFKKAIMLTIQSATQALGKKYMQEQEVVNNLSNMIMELYEAESMALRVEKLEGLNGTKEIYRDMLDVFVYDTASLLRKNAKDAIYSSIEDVNEAEKLVKAVKTLTRVEGVNVMKARRNIANLMIEENEYKF
ncbi:acyl-CoA dehydrogenase family protein [Perlabentimonas gracilis]|uniref:acyl-CoA dehydrogenase family protein n=1 Tax=Perlabentimonas gracilis TaxID=2715279 RepID=UPI001408EAD1|nr:acyl-CoA dehydrogenase family protein [Perlabentimonas gracilis]NHB68171.1 acyl-CoA dehydrogenase [Perlabentimonas gracilis]